MTPYSALAMLHKLDRLMKPSKICSRNWQPVTIAGQEKRSAGYLIIYSHVGIPWNNYQYRYMFLKQVRAYLPVPVR